MIEKTLYASGSGDYSYELNTLLFHVKPENTFRIVGTNGHRLAVIETTAITSIKNSDEEEVRIIVPRKSCSELRKHLKDYNTEITISITDNYILFTIGDVVFYARAVEGRYPRYEAVIPQNDKKASIERIPFLKALKRVIVISKGNTNVVKLEFTKENLLLSTVENSIGEAKDSIEIEDYTAEDPFTVHFNGNYIIDFLNSVTDEKVTIEFNEPLMPILMKGSNSDKYQYVVMPIRAN